MHEGTMSRSEVLKRGAAGAAMLSTGSLLTAGNAFGRSAASVETVRWISPRGTLQVMDDFNLWVPIRMGYFKTLGIEVKMIAGSVTDALASTKFVAQNKADMGYPSPGVLTASIDSGMGVKSVWNVISGQVFDFGLPANSPIKSPKELKGKSIALGSSGWKVIVDPMLVELGISPKSVRYVSAGASWRQAVATGKADAGLAWEGLRAQLAGQGLKLKDLIGTNWSKLPSIVYYIRAADLEVAAK
jgi:NitT/TauT family transport system substrate-binding protein